MPLLVVNTTSHDSTFNSNKLKKELSKALSLHTNKPENYVMIIINTGQDILFGGTTYPSCYVEVKSIGSLEPKTLSPILSSILEDNFSIQESRIYISFEDVPRSNWAQGSNPFG